MTNDQTNIHGIYEVKSQAEHFLVNLTVSLTEHWPVPGIN